jgi:hypothetical protein
VQLLFIAFGLIQGGFSPAMAELNSRWIPEEGYEKVWAIRGQTLCGDALCQVVGAVATPALCRGVGGWVRASWANAAAAAALTVVWQALAANAPADDAHATRSGSQQALETVTQQQAAQAQAQVQAAVAIKPQKVQIAWGIFRLASVQGFVATWTASVFAYLSMVQLAPTVLMSRFGLSGLEAGRYIALGFSVTVPGMLATGAIESALVSRGVPRLTIRRQATLVATVGVAVGQLAFALARAPWQAAAAMMVYSLSHQFNSSGFFPNLQELGGPDSGALQAVANSLGQLAGSAAPPIAFALHSRLGSWAPVNVLSSALLVGCGLLYRRTLSLDAARGRLLEA